MAEKFPGVLVFWKTEIVPDAQLTVTRSSRPSPFRLPRAAFKGLLPVGKSALVAKATEPAADVFR